MEGVVAVEMEEVVAGEEVVEGLNWHTGDAGCLFDLGIEMEALCFECCKDMIIVCFLPLLRCLLLIHFDDADNFGE